MESLQPSGIQWLARQLLTTTGRASRGLFWLTQLGAFLVMGALGAIGEPLPEAAKLALGALALPIVLVLLIVQIKRWHDRDKSGWWALVGFVPCAGMIWVLIECGFLPGTRGANRFGPSPTGQA